MPSPSERLRQAHRDRSSLIDKMIRLKDRDKPRYIELFNSLSKGEREELKRREAKAKRMGA